MHLTPYWKLQSASASRRQYPLGATPPGAAVIALCCEPLPMTPGMVRL